MKRNDRVRATWTKGKGDNPAVNELYMEPSFALQFQGGPTDLLRPKALREVPLLIDGKLERFQNISLGGKSIPVIGNEVILSCASSLIQRHRNEPQHASEVSFGFVDLRYREAFFADLQSLEGALWTAHAPLISEGAAAIESLQAYVPTYSLLQGSKHLRVRDCLDLLAYAASNATMRSLLTSQ